VRIEATPKAGHNRLRPVAGWLRLADRPKLPMPVKIGLSAAIFRPGHVARHGKRSAYRLVGWSTSRGDGRKHRISGDVDCSCIANRIGVSTPTIARSLTRDAAR
jgi:hypothetical protein